MNQGCRSLKKSLLYLFIFFSSCHHSFLQTLISQDNLPLGSHFHLLKPQTTVQSYNNNFLLFQEFSTRQSTIESTQLALYDEVKQQSAKFGDDVKYLAEFTAGIKKFDPWIQKADAKRAVGMLKPKNLDEANDQLASAQVNLFHRVLQGATIAMVQSSQLDWTNIFVAPCKPTGNAF